MSRKPRQAIPSRTNAAAPAAAAARLAFEQATALVRHGQYADAVAGFDKAIALDRGFLDAHQMRGGVLFRLGQYEAALASFDKAVAIDPGFAHGWNSRGSALLRLRQPQAALESFHRAAQLAPMHPDAYYNAGCVLNELKRFEAALASFDQAIALNPGYAEAHNNKAVALAALTRYAAALDCHDAAIRLNPRLADSHVNCGVTLQLLGRHEDARACYEQAVAAAPDNARAHWSLALCCLLTGDLTRGWQHFEWRWRYRGGPDHCFEQPRWSGEPLQGKSILLWAEQGLGDTLQFCRYAESVAKLGAKVILRVPRALVGLLATVPGANTVVAEEDSLPATDFHCPLMSLPLAFNTVLEDIPASTPYLHADADKRAAWQQRLDATTGLRVGLVWSGGFRADQPETWEINQRRNIPLDKLAALELPGVAFFSLQKGDDAVAQLKESSGPRIADFTAEFEDFADTAAFIDNLDLIVSVDTSTAHLAGAMGKEVWLLNRFDTCWRWLQGRNDSPWYPGLRLFRQPAPGDWDSVAAALREALIARLERR